MAYKTQGIIRLSTDSNKDCGYIYVEDVTTYPVFVDKERDDLGLALFWSVDDFATILDCDIGNGNDWYIDSNDYHSFQIQLFVVDIWDSGETYDASTYRCIVWHDLADGFYMQTTNGSVTTEPGSVAGEANWALLALDETDPVAGGTIETNEDLYDIFYESLYTQEQKEGTSLTYITTNCPLYNLQKDDCHEWTILDRSGSDVTVTEVRLSKYDGTLLDDELEFTDSECAINLESYDGGDDGVYLVEVWGTESGDSEAEIKATLIIFDMCDAEECYKQLFRYVICKCNDPCNDTDCNEQYDISERRYDMNMIWGLYTMISNYVFVDKWKNMGILTIGQDRLDFIMQVGRMIDKLKVVADRCGMCSDDATNDITC